MLKKLVGPFVATVIGFTGGWIAAPREKQALFPVPVYLKSVEQVPVEEPEAAQEKRRLAVRVLSIPANHEAVHRQYLVNLYKSGLTPRCDGVPR